MRRRSSSSPTTTSSTCPRSSWRSRATRSTSALIGGRRNQEKKRERLREAGVDDEALERISGPCGLDLGADSVPETALSILAEALAARNGRAGGPLKETKQRIHVEAP